MAGQLLQLVAGQVRLDVPLPFSVRDPQGKLLLAKGQVLTNEAQLQALLARGLYVDLDEVRAARARPAETPATRTTLFGLWEQSAWRLDRLLRGIGGEPGFEARCTEFARQFMALVQRDPDIAIYLSMRQDPGRIKLYGLTHALHVAMVARLLATRLDWPEPRAESLVKAGLTMNLGIIDLQGWFATMGRLSEAQMTLIRAHPQQATEALRSSGVSDADWLEAVIDHHERPDGSGYARGTTTQGDLATALRMIDVFMAKISPRESRPALPIQDAARQMFQESQGSSVAAAIIKEYGIYPPGDFVQLASGELAVVIRRGATAHTPLAAAITDRKGLPMVNTPRRDTAQAAYAIVGPARDKKLVIRVPPERLYGLPE